MPTTPLARNVRKFRLRLKMSQLQLAHEVGYKGPRANSFVCAVEKGRREPRITLIKKLAKALGVSATELIN